MMCPLCNALICSQRIVQQVFMCEESSGCSSPSTHALRLDIMENHGHSNYTCIYNIKVFGHAEGSGEAGSDRAADEA